MTKLIFKGDKPLFPKLINHFWAMKSLSNEHRSLVKFFGTIVMWPIGKHFAKNFTHLYAVSFSLSACSTCLLTWSNGRSITCIAIPQQRIVILLIRSSCSQMVKLIKVCMRSMPGLTSNWLFKDRAQVSTSAIAKRLLTKLKLLQIRTVFATNGSIKLMEATRSVKQ